MLKQNSNKQKKKVVSFSLFGNSDIYCRGAIENAKLSPLIYNEWEIRFYVSDDVPISIVEELARHNVTIIKCRRTSKYDGLFWRFLPFYDEDVSAWVSRDCDSRISLRERLCVDEWLLSGKSAHIIRDSFNHSYEIMAGMFGINNDLFKQRYTLPNIINKYAEDRENDQTDLKNTLWPIIINDHVCHDYWEHNIPKFELLTYQPTDFIHYDKAYDCGLKNYMLTEKKKRHPDLYLNQDNRNFPVDGGAAHGVYIGQRLSENNEPIFDIATRWEYELRGLTHLIKY